MRSLIAVLFAIPLLLAAAELTDAAGKGQSQGQSKGKSGEVTTQQVIGAAISAAERAIIGNYIQKARTSQQGLPPGLAMRAQLPPGLQKHIERTGRLPPGLQKRLPGDLRALLPRRVGEDFRVVGDDIVLIETATNVILDVMKGVLRN
ncbi:MAG: hypothetical protein ACE5KF_01565 [Kiloniellaceae bacterium]